MTTEGFFDFLRGDRTISVVATEEKEEKAADNIASNEKKNENWILYTLNPESKNCPLNCLIISNYFKFVDTETVKTIKIVNCTSCSPNGNLPILVAESDGHVLETSEIIQKFFKIDNISLYAAIDGLLGDYIRAFSIKHYKTALPKSVDVIELLDALPSASLEPSTTVLLYSMLEGVKMHLKQSDPVRMAVERCEYLNELFINLLESNK